MRATIWSATLVLPDDFCFNCGTTRPTHLVPVASEGGLAGRAAPLGGVAGALAASAIRAAAPATGPWEAVYCGRCAQVAGQRPPALLAGSAMFLGAALVLLMALPDVQGGARVVFGALLGAVLVGFVLWLRRVRRPPEPGQTSRGRAFAVLHAGKDLLRGNRPFVRIEYTNPRLLAAIRRLNPGTTIETSGS